MKIILLMLSKQDNEKLTFKKTLNIKLYIKLIVTVIIIILNKLYYIIIIT